MTYPVLLSSVEDVLIGFGMLGRVTSVPISIVPVVSIVPVASIDSAPGLGEVCVEAVAAVVVEVALTSRGSVCTSTGMIGRATAAIVVPPSMLSIDPVVTSAPSTKKLLAKDSSCAARCLSSRRKGDVVVYSRIATVRVGCAPV